MTPTIHLLRITLGLVLFGILASLRNDLALWWQYTCFLVAAAAVVDALLSFTLSPPFLVRKVPGRFALNEEAEVELVLANPNRLRLRVSLFDGIPSDSRSPHMPWEGTLPSRQETSVLYRIRLVRRGICEFTRAHLQLFSPLRLWARRSQIGEVQQAHVYPNFEPILRLVILALQHRESQMGIIRKNLAGVSREFHQMRDYNEGDMLSQIDWKASSKHLSLVSREYEEQRDQTIILMLDCGRRMRSMDGDLPQFDHCLNSMLLLSYVALRQGDQIGILGFGETTRWFPPVKGQHSMSRVLNFLYDFESEPVPSDYAEAVRLCLSRQKRRALVVLLTNLRSEDSRELEPALRTLRSRHLVMLASLREREVDRRIQTQISTLDQALSYTSAHMYAESREQILHKLRNFGVLTLDETAQDMPVALSNKYFEIKQMGKI